MPFTDEENDHLNRHGLLCAGRDACPACRRCGSCDYIYPGRALLDFHSTPTAIEASRFCADCTRWLKSIAAVKAQSPSVEHKPKRRRSTV
jgi:hypothetical protein